MLCRIKAALALTTLLPIVTFAATDKDCLNHLGGAFGDVECYNGLSNDLRARNQDLYVQVTAMIPKDNKNRQLLERYKLEQEHATKFCELNRESLTKWVREKSGGSPRYVYQDVAYYECVYPNLLLENKFLRGLRDNAAEK